MRVSIMYSTAEGGWYAEIWDARGRTVHTTSVCKNPESARRKALNWLSKRMPDKPQKDKPVTGRGDRPPITITPGTGERK